MRKEWKTFWYRSFVRLRSLPLALGISFVFYLTQYSETPADQRWQALWLSLQYGLNIYMIMWVLYIFVYAQVNRDLIRTGKWIEPSRKVHVFICFTAMILGVWVSQRVVDVVTGRPHSNSIFLYSLLSGTFISLMFMFYYMYKHSNAENLKLKAAHAEAKYSVLENQMNPHFLFNSLNSLSQLISVNMSGASEMAQKLSDLYREILQNSKNRTATLASEISIVEKYLALEKIRFGERLQTLVIHPPNADSIYIPSLALQTLVENSIKHGISKSVEGGKVTVNVVRNANGYEISVVNTACEPLVIDESRGTGLQNTRTRLDLLYGPSHGFQITNSNGETTARFMVTGVAAL
jgi:LytS/YehU family sensor histidine kinase